MPGQFAGRPGPPRGGRPVGSPLGGLVGAGPSKVGVCGAMRARDVSRPRPDQLAAADADADGRTPPGRSQDSGSGGSSPDLS